LRRSDFALVCDLGAAVRLPSRELRLLQAVLEALPPALAERACVFLALDAAEAAARDLLVPWVEPFGPRCRVLPLQTGDRAARAFDLARGAALAEARAVLLLGGAAAVAALGDTLARRDGPRGRWAALLTEPALLRLEAAGASAAPELRQEAALERAALALLDALWLPPGAAEELRRLGPHLPAETGTFTPPCALAESLLPWLAAARAERAEGMGGDGESPPALLCFLPTGVDPAPLALLGAVEDCLDRRLPLRRLTLVAPAGAAAAPQVAQAAARLEDRRGLAVEALNESDLPALARRLAEPGVAAVVLPPSATLLSEPLELCRRLGLPTLAPPRPALRAQLAGSGFEPRWSLPEREALAADLPNLLAAAPVARVEGASLAAALGPADEDGLPDDFAARLAALLQAGAPPLERPAPARRVAVAVRGASSDPALHATLLSLRGQSLPASEVLLLDDAAPAAESGLPRLLLPPPLPERRLPAAEEAAWRAALSRLDADLLLLLRAGDQLAPWALERLAADSGEAVGEEILALPVAHDPGALLPDPAAPASELPAAGEPAGGEEPLLLPPALLGREQPPRRRHPTADCLRRSTRPASPAPPPPLPTLPAAGEARPCEAGPEQNLALAARWLREAEAFPSSPPRRARASAPPPRRRGAAFAGLLLGYAPRAGAALLLATLQGHPEIAVAPTEAFAGVPGGRQLDHLALLRRQARGWRGRRFVLRGQLAHCADAEGLADAAAGHDLAVVVLQRQNRVRQAISQINAERCRLRHGTEHPIAAAALPPLPPLQLAPALLEERLEALAAGEKRMEAVLATLLARVPDRVFLLTYEQLEADLPAATAALSSLLGLPPRPLPAGLGRLTPERNSQALAEIEELFELYRGTPLAALLRDPVEDG